MDQTQEQMQFMGSLGIFAQSFKTIFNFKKLFAGFTFTLAFPLAINFILHMDISNRFFYGIEQNPYLLILGAFESYRSYYQVDVTQSIWLYYVLFKMLMIANIIVLSIPATRVIVYTIASIYTGRDITFTKAMGVRKNGWKRLSITLLSMFLTFSAYNLLFSVVVFICNAIYDGTHMSIILIIISVPYVYWSLYLLTIWEIASVVTVLEDSYGLKAAIKAIDLMSGKKHVALGVSFMWYLFMGVLVFVYMKFYLYNNGALGNVWLGIIALICGSAMLVIGFLVIIVVQTMLYLVCKSHHQETIDLGSLSTYAQPIFRARVVIQLGRPQNQAMAQV